MGVRFTPTPLRGNSCSKPALVGFVAVAGLCLFSRNVWMDTTYDPMDYTQPHSTKPFVPGPVNAAVYQREGAHKRKPTEHWSFIEKHADFVGTFANSVKESPHEYDRYNQIDLEDGFHDITRCVLTQFALTHYFCGPDVALFDISGGLNRKHNLYTFINKNFGDKIRAGKEVPEVLFRLHLPSVGDHTFVLHMLPNGKFTVYQSFIRVYTLKQYMSQGVYKTAGQPFIDLAGLKVFLKNVYTVVGRRIGHWM
eukprot:GDKI01040418.1.p1 GENE.GDKI01040418.1~~GDKI01040418.1.p1  ORF type:complete len:252 (-),score=32.41 GDKI01040418.1:370-1125(-)